MLSKALKAGSRSPREATSTARTTAASMLGKASISVAWFCEFGESGRGGCVSAARGSEILEGDCVSAARGSGILEGGDGGGAAVSAGGAATGAVGSCLVSRVVYTF